MMSQRVHLEACRACRRGLSMLELLLALTITSMVAMAIAAMLGAVSTGVDTTNDVRSVLVRANGAQMRLSAYIAPSLCLLDADASNLTLWLDDTRESDSVHASEIRWLLYDGAAGTIDVYYVDFPDSWTQTARELQDRRYPKSMNWASVLSAYDVNGYISSQTLVDGLARVTITTNSPTATSSTHVEYRLTFATERDDVQVVVAAPITQHSTPAE